MNITTLGIDLAKQIFQLHGVDYAGHIVLCKRISRTKLLAFVANLPPCFIGMEASSGAHHWARAFQAHGHTVKLMAPQFVKPYVKTNKNDANDAEAICEAVRRPQMRFVAIKTVEQQDIQAVHRIRARLVKERTALVNQTRGLLAEYGLVVGSGLARLRRALPQMLENTENSLTPLTRTLMAEQLNCLQDLDRRICAYDERIQQIYYASPLCRRLGHVDGVGPLTATALVAAVGDARTFQNGRQMAAWLGLVPRQQSSGGKPRLLGISKRGDTYLRTLLIHGARAVISRTKTKTDGRSRWLQSLEQRRGRPRATVALANKNARILWALMAKDTDYCAAT